MSQDSTSADPGNCRPHLRSTRERRSRVSGPAERDCEGGGTRSDAEAQPGVRDEVCDAGLQQAGGHHGSTARGSRTDLDSTDRRTTPALLHQSH